MVIIATLVTPPMLRYSFSSQAHAEQQVKTPG
jgi:hypothetical protein